MRKVILLGLSISIVIFFAAAAQAAPILMASATGSQQIGSEAQGVDPITGILTDAKCVLTVRHTEGEVFPYKLQCFDITGVTAAHIHVGSADGTGGIAVSLFASVEATGDINGLLAEGSFGADDIGLDMTPDSLNTLMHEDGTYLNVHTAANLPGEVRGQIVAIGDANVVEEFFLATASGGQQRLAEPVDTDATCIASFRAKGENLKYKVKCFNIEGVILVHIHLGPAQSPGGVVATLFASAVPTGQVNGLIRSDDGAKSSGTLKSESLSGELLAAPISDLVERMRTDGAYLNVHTADNLEGEVRGQITVVETLAGGF